MPGRRDAVRVLVLSDSHLSAGAPEAMANWAAAAGLASGVELVVHAGDLTLDGAEHDADIECARQLLDRLPVPWMAVPGNHDIGDNPGSGGGPEVGRARLSRWQEDIGADHWAVEVGGWTLVGINAQLFGSTLAEAGEQWSWLNDCLNAQPREQPVALISHKPLDASVDELAGSPSYRFVPAPGRQDLTNLLDGVRCPLVVSGHVHQSRILDRSRRHVWAPTTWAVLPEWAQSTVGVKRCGALWLELGSDGEARIEFLEPPGLKQLTLGDDLPDPYLS
jgi:3',5'-cyclic AMP phosphodiesterase CpdA